MQWKKAAELLAWRGGGIRRRLLGIGLLFLGVALLANTIAGSLYTRSQIRKAAAQLHAEVASKIANEIADIMERKKERLSDLAVSLSLYEFGSEGQRLLALLLLKNDRAFTGLAILDGEGMEVVKVSERRVYLPSELSEQSDQEYFNKAINGQTYVSSVYTTDKAEPYVTVAVPIKAGPGRVVGVIAAEVNLNFLWQIIGDVSFSKDGHAYLVDSQGNLIAHQDPSLVLKRTNLKDHFKVQEFLLRPGEPDASPAAEGLGLMGRGVLSTYAPVRDLGWAVVLTEPVDIALADLKKMERYAILLLGIGLVVGSIIIVWASNRITEPIRELHRGVEVIGEGNLDHRVEIKTGDEIEQLAHEFNKMAGDLKNSYATLEQRVEQRTRELSALYDVTTTVNQSLELDRVLQEVIAKITGIFHFDTMRIYIFNAQDELEVRTSFPPGRDDLSNVRSFRRGQGIVGKVADGGEAIIFEDTQTDPRYQELSHTRNTKKTGFSFFAAVPIKTKLRSVGAIVCNSKTPRRLTADEIQLIESMADQIGVAVENANLFYETKRKSMELEEANIELVEANRAKADFLAAMSHELRTPLNVIIGNADLIKDGTFGEISGKQKIAVEKILHYSETLLKLINDVLTLTKVEARKVSLHLSTFDVDEIITHAQSYVEQLNRNGHLEVLWQIEPNLPPMTTDALKLEEILQNLIGNAFKFTSQGRIEVRVRDLRPKNRIEFTVADTGIGIAAGDLDRIFEQFQQLKEAHTGSYSGVGLGLSIVKRYVEMMEGEIRVESRPGEGSTFTFDLPCSIQPSAD